eukprot:5195356-Prymnesium_polylepis.1
MIAMRRHSGHNVEQSDKFGKSKASVPPEDSEGMQHRGDDRGKEGLQRLATHKKVVESSGAAGIMSRDVRRKRQDSKIFRELKQTGEAAEPPRRPEATGSEQLLYYQEDIAQEEAAKPRQPRSSLRSEASEIMYGKDGEGAQFRDIAKRRPKLFEGAGGASSQFLIRTDVNTPLYRFDGNVEAIGDESGKDASLDLRRGGELASALVQGAAEYRPLEVVSGAPKQ